jgi:hypothetical protein
MNSKRQKIRAALGRQSTNIEDRRGEVVDVNYDDIAHALPGALSDWDAVHRRHLMNTAPLAQQMQSAPDMVTNLLSLQDSVQPSRLTEQGPIDSSLFQMGPTGNWGPSYPTALEQRSSRWRPGLRYAPWNMQ